jgi:zinc/manganese transport system substrate-binding protein
VDPHAWQDLKNGKIYAENIRAALVTVLPAARDEINARAQRYIDQIDALDQASRTRLDAVPEAQRRVISSHDAFGYFAQAYGVEFFAAQGWSTDREVSAADMATLIREIRKDQVRALFVENMSDPRLMQRVSEETGVRIGGKLYSDALSAPGTDADTYLKMFSSNVNTILQTIEP